MKLSFRPGRKTALLTVVLIGVNLFGAKTKNKEPQEHVEVLPTFVVIGTRIPSSWLEVAWECRGPMPVNLVKRAWISRVQAGSPPAGAGFKTGDNLLAIGSVTVETMSGLSLQENLRRERYVGTREEFTLQTPGEEPRRVVIVFTKDAKR